MAGNIKRLMIETAGMQIKQRNWTGMDGVKMATSVASITVPEGADHQPRHHGESLQDQPGPLWGCLGALEGHPGLRCSRPPPSSLPMFWGIGSARTSSQSIVDTAVEHKKGTSITHLRDFKIAPAAFNNTEIAFLQAISYQPDGAKGTTTRANQNGERSCDQSV